MPTGYTSKLCEQDISFREFAVTCARAFGACMEMRDMSLDIPIPEEFKPDTDYHDKALAKAEEKQKALNAMTDEELLFEEAEENAKRVKECKKTILEKKALVKRLKNMLEQVMEWEPPTEDHYEFKKFMVDQLEQTIRFDGQVDYYERQLPDLENVEPMTAEEIREKRQKAITQDVEYHTEYRDKAIANAARSTAWVKALRDALPHKVLIAMEKQEK